MGDTASNVMIGAHYNSGQFVGYKVHVHLGSSSVNTFSPDGSASDVAAFRTAAINNASDKDLDDLGVEAWGGWYTTNVAGVAGARAQLRLSVQRLAPPP